MKPIALLAVVFGALLIGMGMVFGAPAHLDEAVRAVLGLGYAAAFALVLRGPIGTAIADQLRGGTGSGFEGRLLNQLDDLTTELQAMRDELGQVHDRLDFAERLLTQGREPALRPGADSGNHP